MSNKNILQEYCQQNKIKLPIYNTINTGTQFDIEWTSAVTFNNKKYTAKSRSKIAAEQAVAHNIIKDMRISDAPNLTLTNTPVTVTTPRKQKVDSVHIIDLKNYKTIFLVDSENCELTDQDIDKYPNALFVFFCAKNTTKMYCFRMQESRSNAYVFISQSIGRDAADHLLSYILGIMVCIDTYKNTEHSYYVITKDHYGECLEKFNSNIRHICDLNEL